ncbi:MAG: hypothetical protein ACI9TV_000495 [Sulfurimonas sp.]|jgi:hypothetical protein|uniref:cadherin domain-containing protein n=1 Tax=Sulfurimonas sp. TaxID=2022749 RepID=UPI0039E51E2E
MKNIFKLILVAIVSISTLQAREVSLEDKISSLYISFFNRAADESGLTYWNNLATAAEDEGEDSLNTLKQLSAGFATHPTFGSTYDSMGNEAFIQAIYKNSLGQDGDADGVAYWTNLINNGKLRSDMVAEFMNAALITDITAENFPTLSQVELDAAIQRQNLITNKVSVAINFTKSLGILSNVTDSENPENDPSYLASIEVLKDITTEASTATQTISKLNDLRTDTTNAIAIINNDWKFTFNALEYSTIISKATGRTWLDRNLGASTECSTQKDAECYGDYYQWGRDKDGHEQLGSAITLKAFSTLKANTEKFVISNNDWTQADTSGALRSENWDICPVGYEVPTIDELLAETQSSENTLNIPFSGQRTKSGPMKNKATDAYLQSNTASTSGFTKMLKSNTSILATRTTAAPIRCIKTQTITGIVIDSAVAGLDYTCSSGNSGVTNANGEFTCQVGDIVSFSLAGIYLGEVPATAIITPRLLFAGNNPAAALNFAQLLQTLDSDGDPSNGIDIDEALLATLGTIDFTSLTFDEDMQEQLGSGTPLVSESDAQEHLNETFAALSIDEYADPVTPVDPVGTNNAPTITSSATASVDENQNAAIDINATDSDADTLVYSISGTDADSFNINSSTGIVIFKAAPDYENKNSYTFTVLVSDGNLADTQNITISILNVAETEPTLDNSTGSVDENSATGTAVGNITISVVGDTAITAITLSGTGSDNFEVSTSGAITVKTGASLDYETTQSYSLTAVATNSAGNSASVDLTVSVANITDSVPILTDFTGFIDENVTIGTVVGNITAIDDGSHITAFTLNDTTNFEVDATGHITTGTTFDYEITTSYSLIVTATNGIGVSASVNVTIDVNNIGDFYIKSVVYDNSRTTTPDDDKLYVYFDQEVNPNSVGIASVYDIQNIGIIGNSSVGDYNDTNFHRHKVSLNSTGTASTAFVPNNTSISIVPTSIQDSLGEYLEIDTNPIIVAAFKPILKSGQILSYEEDGTAVTDSSVKDDGYYERGITRSYTNNGDNTVTDNVRGLMWEDLPARTGTVEAGQAYCASLDLGGYTVGEWRLPTIIELQGLVDFSQSNPSIDGEFENTALGYYLSDSANVNRGGHSLWVIYFISGNTSSTSIIQSDTHSYRCVRIVE